MSNEEKIKDYLSKHYFIKHVVFFDSIEDLLNRYDDEAKNVKPNFYNQASFEMKTSHYEDTAITSLVQNLIRKRTKVLSPYLIDMITNNKHILLPEWNYPKDVVDFYQLDWFLILIFYETCFIVKSPILNLWYP